MLEDFVGSSGEFRDFDEWDLGVEFVNRCRDFDVVCCECLIDFGWVYGVFGFLFLPLVEFYISFGFVGENYFAVVFFVELFLHFVG